MLLILTKKRIYTIYQFQIKEFINQTIYIIDGHTGPFDCPSNCELSNRDKITLIYGHHS